MNKKKQALIELAEYMDRNGIQYFGFDGECSPEVMYIQFNDGDYVLLKEFASANDLRRQAERHAEA